MSVYSLAQYYAAVSSAIRAEDVKAVPGLLVMMASDGYRHEAETLRRDMTAALALEDADEITTVALGDADTPEISDRALSVALVAFPAMVKAAEQAAKVLARLVDTLASTQSDLLPGADIDAFAISGPQPPGIPTPIRTAYPYDEPGASCE